MIVQLCQVFLQHKTTVHTAKSSVKISMYRTHQTLSTISHKTA